MADLTTPNPMNNQTATLRDGRKLDVNSPEVQAYMKQYPAVNIDAALGSVANMMNAQAAGQQTMPTPVSAGTPGFGGGLSPGQKPQTFAPIPAPQGPTGAGVGPTGALNAPAGAGGQVGSNSAFMAAYSQIMGKAQQNQSLQDQKNKLIAQLYDHPLTPEELRTLSPAQQAAIQNGDKSMIEYQITSLNDIIKGRADDTKNALDYMLQGYQADQAAAKQAQDEADKKRDDARTVILDVMNKYSSDQLAAAGITQDDIQNVLTTGQISADFAMKLSKVQTLAAQKITDTANAPLTYQQALKQAAASSNPAAAWDILKTQIGKSSPTDTTSSSGAGNRADRNNNPLNIKVGGSTQKWIDNGSATLDPTPATDGGKFLKFTDPKQGLEAAKELLTSSVYSGLTLDAAMKKWSGGGYGAEVAPELDPQKKISAMSSQEIDNLINDMSVREGYTGGAAQLTNPFALNSASDVASGPINTSVSGYSTKPITGGLTQAALDQKGIENALTGKMPSLGLGAAGDVKAAREAIINRSADFATLAGTDEATLQQAYKANTSALSKLTYYGAQVGQFEKTASLNFDVAIDAMNQVDSSGSPLWNKYAQAVAKNDFGDKQIAAFQTALKTFSMEYAKLMSGSVSASGATVSSQKDAEDMIASYMTKGQVDEIGKILKKDMNNRLTAIDQTIKGLDNGLVAFYDAIYGRTDKPAGGGNTGSGTIDYSKFEQ